MKARGTASLVVILGLISGPVASLYCDTQEAVTMACCQGQMASCHQVGQIDDCCPSGPASRDTSLDVVKVSRLRRTRSLPLTDAGLAKDCSSDSRPLPTAGRLAVPPLVPLRGTPPLRAVLRI